MALDPSSVRLDGKVAVVTGGGAGIGRGIANGFHAFGATVAIWERDPDTCAAAAEEVGGVGITTDVRESGQVDAALARTIDELGPVDILVNNAGGVFYSGILDTSEKGWDALFRSNFGHVLLCTQRVARTMVEGSRPGSIVNVTSIEGVRAAPGFAAYSAAKAGVVNLTKTAALELAPHGIRVNAIAPGLIRTRLTGWLDQKPEEARHYEKKILLGRIGLPVDCAGPAAFLLSEAAAYITGEILVVDGGLTVGQIGEM